MSPDIAIKVELVVFASIYMLFATIMWVRALMKRDNYMDSLYQKKQELKHATEMTNMWRTTAATTRAEFDAYRNKTVDRQTVDSFISEAREIRSPAPSCTCRSL